MKCRSPPRIIHGSTPDTVASYRDVLQVICDQKYTLKSGDNQATCLETAKWSQEIITCEQVTCEDIHKFPHGNVNYFHHLVDVGQKGKPVDTIATFSCNSGFQLNNANNISCQGDGQWSAVIPKCQRKCRRLLFLTIKGCVCP